MKIRAQDGELKASSAKLYVNLTFQYSKIVPIRNKIYLIQDQIQGIERQLAMLKAGKT